MILLIIFASVITVIAQFITIYYSYKLTLFVKPLKYWTRAWEFFTIGMVLVAIGRILGLINFLSHPYGEIWFGFESIILLSVNFCLLYFVIKLRELFKKYLNGEL